MKIILTICFIIITICSIAFIQYEYNPLKVSQPISIGKPTDIDLEIEKILLNDKLNKNPDCISRLYTDKYKKEILGCRDLD